MEKVSLKGIPSYSVMNLTGVSDTGKSLMAEQFTVFCASRGDRVAFITVESPANVVHKLPYPIKTPAVLLHEIKLAVSVLEEQR